MIIESGHFCLILALVIALLESWRLHTTPSSKTNAAAIIFALVTWSFLTLVWAYITSDFSLINVIKNSHTAKPFLYKIAGSWGNHEGSILLYVLIIAAYIFHLSRHNKNPKILQILFTLFAGLSAFVIFTASPFDRFAPPPIEGQGLNPVLQDPALAIHPPLLYAGYVGLMVPFAFAVAHLWQKSKQKITDQPGFVMFTLIAWIFLSLGIALGSYWAYYELGWGGYWFWDPVENVAFIPWLIATALIHAQIATKKTGALQNSVLLLSILGFAASLIGTFTVRSGLLTSVHSFANDPTRGIFILGLSALYILPALYLYATRTPKTKTMPDLLSRIGFLNLNNFLLIISAAIIFLGTFYGFFLEIFTHEKLTIGAPYFNITFIPVITLAFILMLAIPSLSWKKTNTKIFIPKIKSLILIFTLTLAILFFITHPMMAFYIALALTIGKTALDFKNQKNIPTALGHAGVMLIIIGITSMSFLQIEKNIILAPGEKTDLGSYNITLEKITPTQGKNYTAVTALLSVRHGNDFVTYLKPEQRFYPVSQTQTTEAAIHTNLWRDLYAVLGDTQKNQSALRLYFNPGVIWIWIGVLVSALGGITSIWQKRGRHA